MVAIGAVLLLALFSIFKVVAGQDDFVLDSVLLDHSFNDIITDIQSVVDDDQRLYVATRGGLIHVVHLNKSNGTCEEKDDSSNRTATIQTTPFLNISAKVRSSGERGLLGFAFHPNYSEENDDGGYFFVHYSNLQSDGVIARYQRMAVNNSDDNDVVTADPTSETILKIVEQPASNHNGGQIQFNPFDGMLYIGFGDGGRSYDQAGDKGYGQNLTSYLGKLLRVNVSDVTLDTWSIPKNNPFVNTSNVLDEIWSYGLRNPWKFCFDRDTGDLYIADVGQNAYEEVNFEASPSTSVGGVNYGWCVCEANMVVPSSTYSHCSPPADVDFQGCNVTPYVGPIIEYPHERFGGSITGGYVYRGTSYPNFHGIYFYADFVQGFIRGARREDDGSWNGTAYSDTVQGGVTTFGEDSVGEIYVGTASGIVYRLKDPNAPNTTGCESNIPTSAPTPVSLQPVVQTTNTEQEKISCPSSYDNTTAILPNDELVLYYSVVLDNDKEYEGILCMKLVFQGLGWLGIGFASNDGLGNAGGMVGAEVIIGTINTELGINGPMNPNPGKYLLGDRAQQAITHDPLQQSLINATIVQDATTTTLSFAKLLVEPDEIRINTNTRMKMSDDSNDGDNAMIWAVGFDNEFSYHNQRGLFTLNLQVPPPAAPRGFFPVRKLRT